MNAAIIHTPIKLRGPTKGPNRRTRPRDIFFNTTRFQGIQGNTQGTLSRTEWYANARRYLKEYNEIPRNTKEYNEIPRNTSKYKRSTKLNRMVCECTERSQGIQRESKEHQGALCVLLLECKGIPKNGMRTRYANEVCEQDLKTTQFKFPPMQNNAAKVMYSIKAKKKTGSACRRNAMESRPHLYKGKRGLGFPAVLMSKYTQIQAWT